MLYCVVYCVLCVLRTRLNTGVSSPSSSGTAAELHCFEDHLQQTLWNNGDCSGKGTVTNQTLNVCQKSSEGEYYENLCTRNNTARADTLTGFKFGATYRH